MESDSINYEYNAGDINLIDIEEINTIAINKIKSVIALEMTAATSDKTFFPRSALLRLRNQLYG